MASSSTTRISAGELFDISPLDSDEKRPVIVFVSILSARWLNRIAILVIGNESDCGYSCRSNPTYEILTLACPARRFFCCIMRGRAAATLFSARRDLLSTPNPAIPTATTAVQSKRPCSAVRRAAGGDCAFTSSNGCPDESCKGRLSVRHSRTWQTSFGGKPLFTWQVRRCRRIPSRNGSERSVHR